MTRIITVIGLALVVVREVLLGVALLLAAVCVVDWMVRTRRISPFSAIARFMRRTVDPLMAPIERRVVRAGGLPSQAPWWALVVVVCGGIVLIALLQFLLDETLDVAEAARRGPGGLAQMLISWTFALLQLALVARVVLSWFRPWPGAWYVRWSFFLTEWYLKPLRKVVPTIGMIDITPIIGWFGLMIARSIIERAF